MKKLRESFRLFYQKTSLSFTHSTESSSQPPHIQQFNDLVQQMLELTKKITEEDKYYLAGKAHDFYLKEAIGPHSSIHPLALNTPKSESFYSIGAFSKFHETENGNTGLVIQPTKKSPAESVGLQKGDMILSIDDFDITKSPLNTQTINDIINRLKGPDNSQIKLKVQKICDNSDHEREITVTLKPVFQLSNWFSGKRFVNIDQLEPLDCNESTTASLVPDSNSELALYIPLKAFQAIPGGPFSNTKNPLCFEFLYLQQLEIQQPQSQGMIIDLRGNRGGSVNAASCMLNTLIESNGLITRILPIKDGELEQTSDGIEVTSYYFTEDGFGRGRNMPYPAIYNKNIVVLVDENSLSASEIFAGTLQDMKRGWVIGRRTSGKGTTQVRYPVLLDEKITGKTNQSTHLEIVFTVGIYTLNSGRSPQGYGIIPDFHVSRTGEPIELDPDYVSLKNQLFFDNILFKNNQWKQNRPDELAQLIECVHKEGRLGEVFRQKIQEDKRYARPYVGDYQLELAKDILKCSPKKEAVIIRPHVSSPFLKKQEKTGRIEQF